ncbi:unnamed protein product [Heterotrigona itama]|uniref:Uncharacterized protein n=1 Tax=Heterotrigona itama TaxID=395501 RepID=A0A6V7HE32_9HYME|nr:unnamed protein product [Heterotrigona itama]
MLMTDALSSQEPLVPNTLNTRGELGTQAKFRPPLARAIIESLNKAKEKANNEGEKLADISHTTSFSFCHVSSPLES